MRLNVRCCCDGERILDTLDVPDGIRAGRVRVSRIAERIACHRVDRKEPEMIASAVEDVLINVREFWNAGKKKRELAVYSDDRPIEFWRDIVGFTEGAQV